MKTKTFFVTGTNTDVGKTFVSKALLNVLSSQGMQVSGFKPVASGSEQTENGLRNQDALQLQLASNVALDYNIVNPYTLTEPLSPHMAADIDGVSIEFEPINQALQHHQNAADIVLVEGAGGWRVPIAPKTCFSSWVQSQQMPVILVVGIELGCINHAMLTAQAIESDGLKLAGWVANRINPGTQCAKDIINFLEASLPAPKLGEIPYLMRSKHEKAAQFIDVEALQKALTLEKSILV